MLVAGLVTACEGPAGQDGSQGPVGPAGADGTDGQDGTPGTPGTPGQDGTDGQDGQDGAPGQDGTDGQDGAPGQDGTDGQDGANAYLTSEGLKLSILGGGLEGTTAFVDFQITDGKGVGLDRNGRLTEGAVAPRITLAYLDEANGRVGQYVAYTLAANGQASTDSGGTYAVLGEGKYRYTLKKAITVADPAKTHRFAVTATRLFQGKTYVDNAVYDFVPAGGTPKTRELVTDAGCNACHQQLEAHGGQRRDLAVCITCHQPQTVDPDTGNSVDMPVMIHKIHKGKELTRGYTIIGYGGAVHDFSEVTFPQDERNCTTCHKGQDGDRWQTHPTRAGCGSCHEETAFVAPAPEGMVMHGQKKAADGTLTGTANPQTDDSACAFCHVPAGGPFAVADAHFIAATDPAAEDVQLAIVSLTPRAAGQVPVLRFQVKVNGQPRDILATGKALVSLTAVIAGPTTDYADYVSAKIQGSGATGTLAAVDGPNGIFDWTPPATVTVSGAAKPLVPAGATGTYAVSLESYSNYTAPGATGSARWTSNNPIAFFSATNETVESRREIVTTEKCNACHQRLALHGGQRQEPGHCATCHHANNTNDERVARVEGEQVIAEPVHLKHMIHKIHMGNRLAGPYVLGGNPAPTTTNPAGAPVDFNEVTFPGYPNNCEGCHVAGTFELPIAAGALPTAYDVLTCTEDPAADADSYCQTRTAQRFYIQPETAACTSCHDSVSTAIHAEVNQTASGESCATCHGAGKDYDVAKVHAMKP